MADVLSVLRELRSLELKKEAGGLSPEEEAHYTALKATVGTPVATTASAAASPDPVSDVPFVDADLQEEPTEGPTGVSQVPSAFDAPPSSTPSFETPYKTPPPISSFSMDLAAREASSSVSSVSVSPVFDAAPPAAEQFGSEQAQAAPPSAAEGGPPSPFGPRMTGAWELPLAPVSVVSPSSSPPLEQAAEPVADPVAPVAPQPHADDAPAVWSGLQSVPSVPPPSVPPPSVPQVASVEYDLSDERTVIGGRIPFDSWRGPTAAVPSAQDSSPLRIPQAPAAGFGEVALEPPLAPTLEEAIPLDVSALSSEPMGEEEIAASELPTIETVPDDQTVLSVSMVERSPAVPPKPPPLPSQPSQPDSAASLFPQWMTQSQDMETAVTPKVPAMAMPPPAPPAGTIDQWNDERTIVDVAPPIANSPSRAKPTSSVPAIPAASDVWTSRAAGGPPVVAGESRVVVHTLEGVQKRGTLRDVDLSAPALDLLLSDGRTERIATSNVKVVFFMVPIGQPVPKPQGVPLTVVLMDGRQLEGLSPDYKSGTAGFFICPLDQRSRAARIYVYAPAVKEIL